MAKREVVTSAKRALREEKRKQEQRRKQLTYGGLAVLVLVLVGVGVFLVTRPAPALSNYDAQTVPVAAADHVPAGTDSGPYPTNPPAGGKHYPTDYKPGFYEEADLANLPKNYEGYLVHNLEHGYVIYWYNCQADPIISCDDLKASIRRVMQQAGEPKLIAFPWPSLDTPLALTTWGKLLKMTKINEAQMLKFTKDNYNKAPEPMAD
jgi:hypothetical protein